MLKYCLVTFVILALWANAQENEEVEGKKGIDGSGLLHNVELTATPEIDDLVAQVELEVRSILKFPDEGEKFNAVSFRSKSEIVNVSYKPRNGTVYFVKVDTGYLKNRYIVLRIFHYYWVNPKNMKTMLHGIKTIQSENVPIEYFNGNLNTFNR